MTEAQQEQAMFLLERGMAGLIPMQALEKLCETEKEYFQYVALREGIIIDLSGMISLFMRLKHPELFPTNRDTQDALERLMAMKEEMVARLDEDTTKMMALIKDENNFKRYMDDFKASRNQA
jgi:hypothetical protein